MLRLFDNANIDFLGRRKTAFFFSALVAIPGLLLFAFRGLNESIEFTGGTRILISTEAEAFNTASIRSALEGVGITGAEITTFGADTAFVIRARLDATGATGEVTEAEAQETGDVVSRALTEQFGAGSFQIDDLYAIGPKVGRELRAKALFAITASFLAVLVYLTFRFEWRFGIAAVAATVHDIVLTIAFLSIMNLEISLVVVAGLLMIVGYSLNDTIITFDRVRENLRKTKKGSLIDILNRSINETLPRTVLTSGTTLVATISLLVLAGPIVRALAWVVTFGIVIGTFSSIFIASPLLLAIESKWPGDAVRGHQGTQARVGSAT